MRTNAITVQVSLFPYSCIPQNTTRSMPTKRRHNQLPPHILNTTQNQSKSRPALESPTSKPLPPYLSLPSLQIIFSPLTRIKNDISRVANHLRQLVNRLLLARRHVFSLELVGIYARLKVSLQYTAINADGTFGS